MAEIVSATDSLNQGRIKLNEAVTKVETTATAAETVAKNAEQTATSEIKKVFVFPKNFWTSGNKTITASSGTYRSVVEELATLVVGHTYKFKVATYSGIVDGRIATITFLDASGNSISSVYYEKTHVSRNFTVPSNTVKTRFSLWLNNSTTLTQSTTATFSAIELYDTAEGEQGVLQAESVPKTVLKTIDLRRSLMVQLTGGAYPTFVKTGSGSNTKITVGFSQTDCTIFARYSDANQLSFFKPEGATYEVPNNQALVWNLDTNKFVVGTLEQSTTNVIILAFNSYGTLYGEWSEFYYRQLAGTSNNGSGTVITSTVPSYYENHLDAKIREIQTLEQVAGTDGESFVFITDIHAQDNDTVSFSLIEQIRNLTNAKKVFNGGDFINAGDKNPMKEYFYQVKNKASFIGNDYFVLRGNHENNNYSTGNEFNNDEVYGMIFKDQEKETKTNKFYYTVNNEAQKIMYIVLDTGFDGVIDNTQLDWFKNELNFIGSDWSVFILVHWVVGGNALDSPNTGMTKVFTFLESYTGDTKIIGGLFGHIHRDHTIKTANNINFLSTTCDTPNQQSTNDPIDRTSGTENQQAFDVVVINKRTRTVNLVRIGAGSNRSFTY